MLMLIVDVVTVKFEGGSGGVAVTVAAVAASVLMIINGAESVTADVSMLMVMLTMPVQLARQLLALTS